MDVNNTGPDHFLFQFFNTT